MGSVMSFDRYTQNIIAGFRGLPLDKSRSKVKKTQTMETLLEKIIEDYGIEPVQVEQSIMAKWRDIVGSRNAPRCVPQKISNGKEGDTLLIVTASKVIETELKFDKRNVLKRLRKVPDCENFCEVIIRNG